MFRRNKWATALWVAAVAMLPLRVANAHLHLCLDGKEAAVSVHVEDAPTHFGQSESVDGHNDRDVEVPAIQAVVKIDGLDQLTLACIAQFTLAINSSASAERVRPNDIASPLLLAPSALRPPPRGPPR